jgi:hypothetical protein
MNNRESFGFPRKLSKSYHQLIERHYTSSEMAGPIVRLLSDQTFQFVETLLQGLILRLKSLISASFSFNCTSTFWFNPWIAASATPPSSTVPMALSLSSRPEAVWNFAAAAPATRDLVILR